MLRAYAVSETGDFEVAEEIVDIWCESGGFLIVAADNAGGEELISLGTLLVCCRSGGQEDGDIGG
jgi:hypothetical protein